MQQREGPSGEWSGPARPILVVLSDPDPVAARVADVWGTPPADRWHLDGAPIRSLGRGRFLIRRAVRHIHDEHLDARLPRELAAASPTLVFPSVHRSDSGVPCLTVHPLGNPGPSAEVGGEPRKLVPTDPIRMVETLRQLAEAGREIGLPVSFEATHHGPALDLPAFFVEIAEDVDPERSGRAATAIARILGSEHGGSEGDRSVLGVGGGHYAPRFTDLALARRWAFGHMLSRYVLGEIDRGTAEQACAQSGAAAGLLYAREGDAPAPAFEGLLPRVRESDAPRRPGGRGTPTRSGPTASGT
jgi:D-aminoacyl-tRNA deacylase